MTIDNANATSEFRPDAVCDESFRHEARSIQLLETHISWVFLTGQFAYKVKKPVNLDFVDFSTLERRKYFCEEELRLNKRLVDGLYLNVVPIGGSADHPRFDEEPAFEYAVKMHQFAQSERLDHVLETRQLKRTDAISLGGMLADMHEQADKIVPEHSFGRIQSVVTPIADNYRLLLSEAVDPTTRQRICQLRKTEFSRLRRLRPALTARWRDGFIRECHGDLHLANLVKFQSRIVPFDCLEFDPALRWIDVMSDVAFPYMDLIDHQCPSLAYEFLNAYLERTGDYAGLVVLNIYATYRAMVRMKVAALDTASTEAQKQKNMARYLDCAEHFAATREARAGKPILVVMHGFSASGKSYLSSALVAELEAIRIRSDVERKRLAGMSSTQMSGSAVGTGIYDTCGTEQTYLHISNKVKLMLNSGFNVIVDATNLAKWQRSLFQDAASETRCPMVIVNCVAPEQTLRKRIEHRHSLPGNVSEADQQVLSRQLTTCEPFDTNELEHVVTVDMSDQVVVSEIARQVLHCAAL